MIPGTLIKRAADSSLLLRSIRRLSRDSFVCAVIAAVMRPSVAYLGGPVAPETEDESRKRFGRAWAIVSDSAITGIIIRALNLVPRAWRSSMAARLCAEVCDLIRCLEPEQRVRLIGWILLIGTAVAGVVDGVMGETWPWPSILLRVAAPVLAGCLMVGARAVSAAWQEFWASMGERPR